MRFNQRQFYLAQLSKSMNITDEMKHQQLVCGLKRNFRPSDTIRSSKQSRS